jgi:predicted transcriptional regulator
MSVDTKWFRDRLADQRLSQRGLARQLGLDSAAVSLMLRGKREMKIAEAAAIARLIGVPADEVMRHAGVQISSKGEMVLVSAYMDASAEVHAESTDMTVPHPGGDLPETLTAIQCRTAGTALDHMDGWVMFANLHMDGSVQADAVGRLSVLRLRDGVMHVAKLARGSRRGVWNLVSPIGTIKDAEVEWAKPILLVTP